MTCGSLEHSIFIGKSNACNLAYSKIRVGPGGCWIFDSNKHFQIFQIEIPVASSCLNDDFIDPDRCRARSPRHIRTVLVMTTSLSLLTLRGNYCIPFYGPTNFRLVSPPTVVFSISHCFYINFWVLHMYIYNISYFMLYIIYYI